MNVAGGNCLEIDLAAVRANYRAICRQAAGRTVIAVIKGDAYGHGAVAVARTLEAAGVKVLAAGSVEEAIAVRRAGVTAPLLVLGSVEPEAAGEFVRHDLIASLDDRAGAEALARAAGGRAPVWIKVDCGYGRFGVAAHAAADFVRDVADRLALNVRGIYTHLPFADAAGRDWAIRQTRAFDTLVSTLQREGRRFDVVQTTASPGLLSGFDACGDVAAGQLLYGMDPAGGGLDSGETMRRYLPALRAVRTRLVHLGARLAGEQAAGYLRECRGPLGVVPIGLCHGYRPMAKHAFMLVRGSRAPVLRVCLEATILDLCEVGAASVGDRVTVIGADGNDRITLEDAATWQGTSALFLLLGLGKSIPRVYHDAGPHD